MEVKLKIYIASSFCLGLGLMIFGYQYGHVSMLSILDVLSGDKALSELNNPRTGAEVPQTYFYSITDDNIYISIAVYHDNLNALLSILLRGKTEIQIETMKNALQPITEQREIYLDSHPYKKNLSEINLKIDKSGKITGGGLDVSARLLTFSLKNIHQDDIKSILIEEGLFTQSSGNIIQSKSVMFEFNSKGYLDRLFRR